MSLSSNGRAYRHPATRDSYELSTRLPPPPPRRLRVLLTGATGYIASQLLPVLRERYDLVLLDVMLPRLDGLEVCRAIRRTSTVPVVMLTARADTIGFRTDTVQRLLGRRPRTFADWCVRNASAFRTSV